MAEFIPTSRGEALLQRHLRTETRYGVTHYVSGQLEATVSEAFDLPGVLVGFVGYVDAAGHACLTLCHRALRPDIHDDGERIPVAWTAVGRSRAGQSTVEGPTLAPAGYRFPVSHLLALRRAERDLIEGAKGNGGGYTAERLAKWGVPWPPPKGWKERLLNG